MRPNTDEYEKECDYTLKNPHLISDEEKPITNQNSLDAPINKEKSLGFNSRPYIDINFYRKKDNTYVFKRSKRSKKSENRCIRQIGIKQNEI